MSHKMENLVDEGSGLRRVSLLERQTAIGFSGSVPGGLVARPGLPMAFYPLGSTVVVRHIGTAAPFNRQAFLVGHEHTISCVDLSPSGKYLVTGEGHDVGTKVRVIIWDTATLSEVGRHRLHHASVVAVSVSPSDALVVSAGGADADFVVWDLADTKSPLCVGRKTYGRPFTPSSLCFLAGRDDNVFVAGGNNAVQVWTFDPDSRKLDNEYVGLGKLKRNIKNMMFSVEESGCYIYCGTDSGDIVKLVVTVADDGVRESVGMQVQTCAVMKTGRLGGGKKDVNAGKFAGGVGSMVQLKSRELLVGSGSGTLILVRDSSAEMTVQKRRGVRTDGAPRVVAEPTKSCLKEIKSMRLAPGAGAITSLTLLDPVTVLVGTDSGRIFQMDTLTFDIALLSTCHTSNISDIAFPRSLDGILGSCGDDGLRLWNLADSGRQQVIHVATAPAACLALAFVPDGGAVVVGLDDGSLRAFTPQSGNMLFRHAGAHMKGVTALSTALRSGIVTGGADGSVRAWLWKHGSVSAPRLLATVREHKRDIVSVSVTKDETGIMTASKDGTCIIWALQNGGAVLRRQRIIVATSSLVHASYHPSESQVITLSIDGSLAYWEVVDGEEIRSTSVGRHGSVTAMDVSGDGETVAVGGAEADSAVKLWRYRQGDLFKIGRADCGEISRVRISPSGRMVAAATRHGAIVTWSL